MTRILLPLLLAFAATHASADASSGQASNGGEPLDYCRGFVAGGLASNALAGMSRVDLWLAWGYVIRSSGALNQGPVGKEYQAGLAQFQNVAADTSAQSILQQADGECGLGSGHQITGW